MQNTTHAMQALLTGLRDFFAAKNAQTLQKAYENLLTLDFDFSIPHCNIDWFEVEYNFNRLFVGPQHVVAPLFASVYLESKGILMGEHTVQMRELMHELHLASPHEGCIPEDFLPYELEVLSILYSLLIEHKENQELYCALLEATTWLEGHLASWLPLFLVKARSQGKCSPPIEGVFSLLEYWLMEHTK